MASCKSGGRVVNITLSPDDLRPLLAEIVDKVVATIEGDLAPMGGRLAITEVEAAKMLSLKDFQLRDERYSGRIKASVGRGGRILYAKSDLLKYLSDRRWKPPKR